MAGDRVGLGRHSQCRRLMLDPSSVVRRIHQSALHRASALLFVVLGETPSLPHLILLLE
jgi:hypothetical protein